MKKFTREEVAKHNQDNDLWVIINNKVYDLTKFSKIHPGGKGVIIKVAGKDATDEFFSLHRSEVLQNMGPKLQIGLLEGFFIKNIIKKMKKKIEPNFCEDPIELFDISQLSQVPYAESSYFSKRFNSPYYNNSHLDFKLKIRKFLVDNVVPFCQDWDEKGQYPSKEIYKKFGQLGIWAARLGPGDHLNQFSSIFGVDPRQFDYFHEMILTEEIVGIGSSSVSDSLGSGLVIGLPPVLQFGSKEFAKKVGDECISGEKIICLAISDPNAGSDVANMTCVAKKSECGKFYIVNGVKKWITNGAYADYFVTGVRTGDQGMFGISMLVIERTQGVTTKQIKTSYSSAAGTAYVIFDNVKVPVENILGEENDGELCVNII